MARLTQAQLDQAFAKGGSSTDAYEKSKERQQTTSENQLSRDAALKQLITGKTMDADSMLAGKTFDEEAGQRNISANTERVREEMRRSGIDPSKSSMTFNESGGSFNPDVDPMGKSIKKALMGANITGYNVADPDRVIPTVKDAEEVKKATGSLKALQGTGAGIVKSLEGTNMMDRFGSVNIPFTNKKIGTQKGIDLDANVTDMVIQLKELANLGAITGPDMQLMESAMGGVTGIGSLLGDKTTSAKALSGVLDRARAKVESNATSRGYAPQQGYLDGPGAAPAQQQDARAARLQELRAKRQRGEI